MTADQSAQGASGQRPSAQDPSAQDPSAQDPSAQDPSAQDPGTQDAFAEGRAQAEAELAGGALLRWAGATAQDYLDGQRKRAVFPDAHALAGLQHFDEPLPAQPNAAQDTLDMLARYGSPATVAQAASGRYFGLVNGGILPVALAARWLADAWDQNAALFLSSPIAAALEQRCEDWLCQLLGLAKGSVAGFVSGSSTAILCGLAAGRYRLLQRQGWDVGRQGLAGAPRLRLIAGRHAHATVLKAVALLGLGTDSIEWVAVDDQGRLDPDDLPPLDASCLVILQAGNVNSGAFDPFARIMPLAQAAGAWVHVDGAFGLWAQASAQLRHLSQGAEAAQSFSLDAHKTLNAPYDNGLVLCSDAEALKAAMAASGSYIVYSDQRDGMTFTPEMSRRARAVETWAVLRSLGRQGLDDLVTSLHQRARQLALGLAQAGFEIRNQVVFNQVLVGLADDAQVPQLIQALQASSQLWVGGASWFDRPVVRVSVCSWATRPSDIQAVVQAFSTARERL